MRSCAVQMAQKYQLKRSVVLDLIGICDGYSDLDLPSSQHIERAIEALDRIKISGVEGFGSHASDGE